MVLTEREIKILEKFYYNKKFKLEDLAKEYNVSTRMIRYNIENINLLLRILKSELIHKNQEGFYQLNIKPENYQLISAVKKIENIDKNKRQFIILLKILYEEENMTVENLKNYFDVSRVTINKDINEINKYIDSKNIAVVNTNYGLRIEGNKEYIKNYIIEILLRQIKLLNSNRENEYIEKIRQIVNTKIDNNIYELIREVFIKVSLEEINFENFYANAIYTQLTYFEEDYLTIDEKNILDSNEYKIIDEILKDKFNHRQKKYIAKHTVFIKSLQGNNDYYNNFLNIKMISKNIINIVQTEIGYDLLEDKILFEFLVNHINSLLQRIKLGYKFEEFEIENKYKVKDKLYEIIKKSLLVLQNIFAKEIHEDEIYLLKYHFEASIERIKQSNEKIKKVIIITSLGQGSKKIMLDNLKNNFHINIHYIGPKSKINVEIDNIDYILTSYDLERDETLNKEIIKISPILTEQEKTILKKLGFKLKKEKILLSNLLKVMEKNCKIENTEKLIEELNIEFDNKIINDLHTKIENYEVLKECNILFEYDADNLKEAIYNSLSILEGSYIDKSYTNEVMEIFDKNNNDIIRYNGVILPHTRNNNNVYKSGISIIQLAKPLVLEKTNEKIELIVSFVIKDEKNMLDIISNAINKVFRQEFKNIIMLKDKEAIINYLNEE